MNKRVLKTVALALCALLAISGTVAAFAASDGGTDKTVSEADAESSGTANETKEAVKNETVYVFTDAEGNVKSITVSDWLKNISGRDTLRDRSDLGDIVNVNGDEEHSANGDTLVWNAGGNDIYYRGSSESVLPVTVSISYRLDGKKISASELAGKSGRVTIRFDYKNNLYQTKQINGKEEKIYVPFVMLTGVLLDNDVFTDVEVTNGKLINDGSRTAVVGIALPGMNDNLGSDSNVPDIPEGFEISAEAKNFSLMNTFTVAANSVFNNIDTDGLAADADSIKEALSGLTDAVKQLDDGAGTLYDGLCELYEKSGTLVGGIDSLAHGAAELDSHSDELREGAKKVFETLLAAANNSIKEAGIDAPELTTDNYGKVIDGITAGLTKENLTAQANAAALEKVTEKVNASRAAVEEQVTKAVYAQAKENVTKQYRVSVLKAVLQSKGISEADYKKLPSEQRNAIDTAVSDTLAGEQYTKLIEAETEKYMQSEQGKNTVKSTTDAKIDSLIKEALNSAEVRAEINAGVEKGLAGRESLVTLKMQLDEYNKFYTGLNDYANGVGSIYGGVLTVKNGLPALTNGIAALRDGAGRLSDGITEFTKAVTDKLGSVGDVDLAALAERLKATLKASESYNSFSGMGDDMTGSVKFIFRTDSIGQ